MAKYVHKIETRRTHPQYAFETRAFDCPDGVTRLITFPDFRWKAFDRFLSRDPEFPLQRLIDGFYHFIPKRTPRAYVEAAFAEIMHVWIIVEGQREKNIYYSVRFNSRANPEKFLNRTASVMDF